jgi:TadE-like protein
LGREVNSATRRLASTIQPFINSSSLVTVPQFLPVLVVVSLETKGPPAPFRRRVQDSKKPQASGVVMMVTYLLCRGKKFLSRRRGHIRDEPTMRLERVQAMKRAETRRGAAAVELATLLPFLIFMSMATVDFSRVANVQVTLQNCARNGALYEFNTQAGLPIPSGWTTLSAAAQADAGTLNVTATASSPGSSTNNSVTVTTTATYSLIALPAMSGFSSLPGSITLTQSATMPYPASASPVP